MSTSTFPAIVIDTDGTMTPHDVPVNPVWASCRITPGIAAALEVTSDDTATGFVLGHGPHKGTATLFAGAHNLAAPNVAINAVATAIVRRYHGGTLRPIRGRALIAAGWDRDPRPIVEPVARALIASWGYHQLAAA